MKILKIHIKNINSLRIEETIDLTVPPLSTTGLFAITGDTGAGKTSILDAITLALYGRVHRNTNVGEVLTYGTTEAKAAVEFLSSGEKYLALWSIRRARGLVTGNLLQPERKLSKWNEQTLEYEIIAEKVKETNEMVEKVTDLDFDRFCRSALLSQGDFAAFLKSGEKERSDLLERITGTEIYTRISKASHLWYKEANDQLLSLQSERQHLSLLTTEEIGQLNDETNILNEKVGVLNETFETLQKQLQWLAQKEDLTRLLQSKKEEKISLEADIQDFENQKTQYEWHEKMLPVRHEILKRKEESNKKQVLTEKLVAIQQETARISSLISNLNNQLEEKKAANLSLVSAGQTLQQKIQQVRQLDTLIAQKQTSFTNLKEQEALIGAKQSENQEKLSLFQNELSVSDNRAKEINTWLSAHPNLNTVGEDIPVLDHQIDTIRNYFSTDKELNQLISASKQRINGWSAEQQQFESEIKRIQSHINEIDQKVMELSGFSVLPDHWISDKRKSVETIQQEISVLEKADTLHQQFVKSQFHLTKFEQEISALELEMSVVDAEILNSLERKDALEFQKKFKEQVLLQQKKGLEIDELRHTFGEGEPCPVCLSLTHPFRNQPFTPFVRVAESELSLITDLLTRHLAEINKLQQKQADIRMKILRFIGEQDIEMQERLEQYDLQIRAFETEIAELMGYDPATYFDLSANLLALPEKIGLLKKRIEKIRSEMDLGEKLISQRHQSERSLLQSESELKRLAAQIKSEAVQVEQLEERLAANKKIMDSSIAKFNEIVLKYGYHFEANTVKAFMTHLKDQQNIYQQHTVALKNIQDSKTATELEMASLKSLMDAQQEQMMALKAQSSQLKSELTVLENERFDLMETSDPDEVWQMHQMSLDQNQVETTALEKALNDNNLEIAALYSNQNNLLAQIDELEISLGKTHAVLQDFVLLYQLSDIDTLSNLVLTEETATQYKQTIEAFRDKTTAVNTEIERLTTSLLELEHTYTSIPDKEDCLSRQSEIRRQISDWQQMIGANKEKLKRHRENVAISKALSNQISAQQKECNRRKIINDLIGSSDGKKFRIFAQGLTLQKLCDLANIHLEQLSGRYVVLKKGIDSLELSIKDTYQGDNIRSMNTLSGGESFLVSLALALGLSDMAGRNVRIQSLFIDEGFGSLDENTLDMAIATLENLQAKGKTIGIISHVQELKERIGTQIRVTKKGSGYSTLEILG